MFDVFYFGEKPNLFPHEVEANTLEEAAGKSRTKFFWMLSGANDYSEFDFNWVPDKWDEQYVHIFPSQWQEYGGIFFANKYTAADKQWKKQHSQAAASLNKNEVVYIEHFNQKPSAYHCKLQPNVIVTRFVDSYLNTFKRIAATAKTEYVWIISSLCDYEKFDFTWHPSQWQTTMLHVFPSNDQKFGDTFYMHVPSFKEQMNRIELLEWYTTINFCDDQVVPRIPMDQVYFDSDSIVDAIKQHTFNGPYALFQSPNRDDLGEQYTPSIWRKKDRSIHVLTESGSVCVVPRDAKAEIAIQCYDYPYIMRHKDTYLPEKHLDIVYISNGEPDAERWYNHLVKCAPNETVHWVKDVNGRAAAYKAAGDASRTPWFFTVFGKLEINPEFDWSWMPDRLQESKHYIFHARNPVNGLEYGHMAMIAYNKRLVSINDGSGLDFTLQQAHEVVPLLSGTAHYNVDPWTTWRTAFREVLKLKEYSVTKPSDINAEYRLHVWLTQGEGKNAEWSLRGAADAIEFYTSVNGDPDKLHLSYEWKWLHDLYTKNFGSDA
jgi:hypothetical protein